MQATQNLLIHEGSLTDEVFVEQAFADSKAHFGPINILVVANNALSPDTQKSPIWDTPLDALNLMYHIPLQENFISIKHFLRSARSSQLETKSELPSLTIVLVGTDIVQDEHAGWDRIISSTTSMLFGLMQTVQDDLKIFNSKASINILAAM